MPLRPFLEVGRGLEVEEALDEVEALEVTEAERDLVVPNFNFEALVYDWALWVRARGEPDLEA